VGRPGVRAGESAATIRGNLATVAFPLAASGTENQGAREGAGQTDRSQTRQHGSWVSTGARVCEGRKR
jgi:hypothetical protein